MMKLARIHRKTEPIWHVQLAIGIAIAVQLFLNKDYVVGPRNILAGLELLLLIAVSLPARVSNKHHNRQVIRRFLSLVLLAMITVTNIVSLILVSHALINGSTSGHDLIISALIIFATNIIVFGLLYWEIDEDTADGKPDEKRDFIFPQQTLPPAVTKQFAWNPTFFDYLYVSITNATAFSPTDAYPITYRAKLLMTIQALASLATIALVAARAVATLSS